MSTHTNKYCYLCDYFSSTCIHYIFLGHSHPVDFTVLFVFFCAAFGVENMATAMDEDLEDELEEKEEKSMMCQPGMHKWKLDQCMVCTVCGDCTGYGASCVSSGRPDRVPGG